MAEVSQSSADQTAPAAVTTDAVDAALAIAVQDQSSEIGATESGGDVVVATQGPK